MNFGLIFLLYVLPYKVPINLWAFHAVQAIASPALTAVMALLSKSFLVVLPVLVLYLYLRKNNNVYSFVIAGLLLFIVSDLIKIIIKEPRPCNIAELSWINHIACENTFSFPSNHASVLTGLVLFLGKHKYVRALYIAWLALILFGRIYLGLHYFTDVIAGMAISIAISAIILRYKDKINKVSNKIVKAILPMLALKEHPGHKPQ